MKIDMDLFAFPFQDKRWVEKTVIGGVVALGSILIVPVFALLGYMVATMRQAMATGEPALPEWQDWGTLFKDGLKAWVVTLGYYLPVYIILCPLYALMVFMFVGLNAYEEAIIIMQIVFFAVFGILMLPIMLLQGASYVGLAHMVAGDDQLREAFALREVWQIIKAGWKSFLLAFLVYYALSYGISMVSTILIFTVIGICLFPFLMLGGMYYMLVMQGALFGLAYRETQQADAAAADAPLPDMV